MGMSAKEIAEKKAAKAAQEAEKASDAAKAEQDAPEQDDK